MKIIYCGLKNENYNPARSTSFEYNNFYLSLKALSGVEVIDYFFDWIIEVGKKKFNDDLITLVKRERPDLLFVFMYTDEIAPETLFRIRNKKLGIRGTTTLAWFSDDHWRLDNYSRFYAPCFDWVVTTWSNAPERYARYGIYNVIRSQWACNTVVWKPLSEVGSQKLEVRTIDVSFVGQRTPGREKIINALRVAGVNITVHGYGWPDGKINQQSMIELLSRSKINLNINEPTPCYSPKRLARLFLKRSVGRIVFDWHFVSNFSSWRNMSIPQIKARPFEILGCRTFLLSPRADDMERYYEDGQEIVYYDGIPDLIEKIHYYLAHPEEREIIAEAGYRRTLAEHTYQKRFEEIFKKIEL